MMKFQKVIIECSLFTFGVNPDEEICHNQLAVQKDKRVKPLSILQLYI